MARWVMRQECVGRDKQDAKSPVAYRVVVELQYIWCAVPYSLLRRLEGTLTVGEGLGSYEGTHKAKAIHLP